MKTAFEILNMEIVLLFSLSSCVRFAFGINGCHRPPLPLGFGNFSPDKEFYKVNDVAHYRCEANHTYNHMFGNSTRVCLENGRWSGSLPYCVQPSAMKLDGLFAEQALSDRNENTCFDVQKGHIIHSLEYFVNSGKHKRLVLQIVSNDRYANFRVMIGRLHLDVTLQKTREFTDGQLFLHLYTFEKSMAFTTSEIMMVISSYDRDWKICDVVMFADIVSSCPLIPKPNKLTFITYDNVPRTSSSYLDYGSAAIFNCRQEFHLKGDTVRYCAENNEWTGSNPSCEAVKCSQEPPAVKNGYWPDWKNGEIYYVNHTLEAVCKSGFVNNGQPLTSSCSYEGSWSLQSIHGQCQAVGCSQEPPVVRNGFWPNWQNGTIYYINHTLQAVCKSGFINNGHPIISTCRYEGSWSQHSIEGRCQESSRNGYSMVLFCAGVGLGIGLTLAIVIFLVKKQKKRTIEEETGEASVI